MNSRQSAMPPKQRSWLQSKRHDFKAKVMTHIYKCTSKLNDFENSLHFSTNFPSISKCYHRRPIGLILCKPKTLHITRHSQSMGPLGHDKWRFTDKLLVQYILYKKHIFWKIVSLVKYYIKIDLIWFLMILYICYIFNIFYIFI